MQKLRATSDSLDVFLKRLQNYKDDLKKGLNQEILGKSAFML